MFDTTEALIEDSREGIRIYTNNFSGDIGKKFKKPDQRLEHALEEIESETPDRDDIYELLDEANSDLTRVTYNCFTGMTPGNMHEYVKAPVEQALGTLEDPI